MNRGTSAFGLGAGSCPTKLRLAFTNPFWPRSDGNASQSLRHGPVQRRTERAPGPEPDAACAGCKRLPLDMPGAMAGVESRGRVAVRVQQEHSLLVQRLDMLRGRLRRDAEVDLSQQWDDFASDLAAHMAYEEHDMFPLLAWEAVDGPQLVARLHAEHAAIRTRTQAIGSAMARHGLQVDALDALAELIGHHSELEDLRLYPWAVAREWEPGPA